jgi:hypothetical protein
MPDSVSYFGACSRLVATTHISLSPDADGLGHSKNLAHDKLAATSNLTSPLLGAQLNSRISQRSSSGAFDTASKPHTYKRSTLGKIHHASHIFHARHEGANGFSDSGTCRR